MTRTTTLLDLVMAVWASAGSEAEVIATVASLVNSGQVTLCGNFAGARFDLAELEIVTKRRG
jgi:hypothetical protein